MSNRQSASRRHPVFSLLGLLAVVFLGSGDPTAVSDTKADVKPLVINLLRPVYRQCIYATEDLREIIFRVRVRNDLAGQAAAIGFRLVDEHGKKMGEGTVPLPQAVNEVRMDAPATTGKYRLTVMARTSNGKELAEAQCTIHRLSKSPGSEVRIDENGNLVVNGRPQVFQIGRAHV